MSAAKKPRQTTAAEWRAAGIANDRSRRGEIAKLSKCIAELATALEAAAYKIEEMGCTCVDRSKGHQRGCVGLSNAKRFYAIAKSKGGAA